MLIKNVDLDNKLIMEIGKFAVLWNCFERFECDNNCNPKKIRIISENLNVDYEKQKKLAEVLNKRRSWFEQNITDYVKTGLHPFNFRSSRVEEKKLMEEFMDQSGDNLTSGCLLVIYRIRNNLMHGLKCVELLNNQYDLFVAVNDVLESI